MSRGREISTVYADETTNKNLNADAMQTNSFSLSHTKPTTNPTTPITTHQPLETNPLLPTPPFPIPCPGRPFATLAVCPAPPTPATQLAVPHSYPLGQHPATGPASAPHMNHPLAQLPVVSAGAPLTGTTTVTPFPFTTVVMACCGGHDVVAQSRPVWQHPPPR